MATTTGNENGPYSEPAYAKTFRTGHDAPYWLDNIDDKISPEIRRILEEYSHVPAEQVRQHVYDTREKLWAVRSYPCTGLGIWLMTELPMCPRYEEILARVKGGGRFVDIGAFMGYDLRRLIFDGAPPENLVAVDIVSHWEIGYDFFRDRDRFDIQYITSDVLEPTPELQALQGTVDVVSIAHVIHQWPRRTQIKCIQQLVKLTRPGALLVGYQAGNINPRPLEAHAGVPLTDVANRPEVHDGTTFAALWREAGASMGVDFEVHARLREWADVGRNPKDYVYMGDDMKLLEFVVERKN